MEHVKLRRTLNLKIFGSLQSCHKIIPYFPSRLIFLKFLLLLIFPWFVCCIFFRLSRFLCPLIFNVFEPKCVEYVGPNKAGCVVGGGCWVVWCGVVGSTTQFRQFSWLAGADNISDEIAVLCCVSEGSSLWCSFHPFCCWLGWSPSVCDSIASQQHACLE